jgi:hypothetical protein
MEHDAADRSRYPLAIDQDNSTPINFAESINFPPFQKIRTQAVYTRCLRCAGAPWRPASGSGLSLTVPSWHVVL